MGFLSVCTWKDFEDGGDGGFGICVDDMPCWGFLSWWIEFLCVIGLKRIGAQAGGLGGCDFVLLPRMVSSRFVEVQ